MDKMREEFETWVKGTFNIDCSEMFFGIKDDDTKEQYYSDDDDGGALSLSAMFYAWKASRAALFVELPQPELGDGAMIWSVDVEVALDNAGVSYK